MRVRNPRTRSLSWPPGSLNLFDKLETFLSLPPPLSFSLSSTLGRFPLVFPSRGGLHDGPLDPRVPRG